jgi:hypothetical protein
MASVENSEHLGYPSMSKMDENIIQIWECIQENIHLTIYLLANDMCI